jgi:hypothetical protein
MEPHFPRNPGFTCIVLTMSLYGQCCPQFAPKNSAWLKASSRSNQISIASALSIVKWAGIEKTLPFPALATGRLDQWA